MRLVRGVGTNDAGYPVTKKVKGKVVWKCPYYRKWENMLQRVYSYPKPTYVGCSVCKSWLTFSNFKSWMEVQIWLDMDLDKDILQEGNKVYSPDTCRFVSKKVNYIVIDKNSNGFLSGVKWVESSECYVSSCSNPYTKKVKDLGWYSEEYIAHLVWKDYKTQIVCMLEETENSPPEIILALYEKYALTEEESKYLNTTKEILRIRKRYRVR